MGHAQPRRRIKLANGEGKLAVVVGSIGVIDDRTLVHLRTGRRIVVEREHPVALAEHLNAVLDWRVLDALDFGQEAPAVLFNTVQAAINGFQRPAPTGRRKSSGNT